jgi:hypothetical protein
MTDAGMPMPALVLWMPMPTYDILSCLINSYMANELASQRSLSMQI